jgi:YVTN family beta-propeller protein
VYIDPNRMQGLRPSRHWPVIAAIAWSISASAANAGGDACVYIANQASGTVSLLDTTTHRVFAIEGLESARSLALSLNPSRLLITSGRRRGVPSAVYVVDLASGTKIREIPLFEQALGITVEPGGEHAWVAHLDGRLTRVALGEPSSKTVFNIGRSARHLVYAPEGRRVYVTGRSDVGAEVLWVIDAGDGHVTATVPLPGRASSVAVAPGGRRMYVPELESNTITVIDTLENRIIGQVPVGLEPIGVSVSPVTGELFAANQRDGTVSVIDAEALKVTRTIRLGSRPSAIAADVDGHVYVALDHSLTGLAPRTYAADLRVEIGAGPSDIVVGSRPPDGCPAFSSKAPG